MSVTETTFPVPLTAFQAAALRYLGVGRIADLRGTPAIQQHPYVQPRPGAANQYLTLEWTGQLRIYLYGDEIGFDGFTLERQDFATDEAQIEAAFGEIARLRSSVS